MEKIKTQIQQLPTVTAGEQAYLSYNAVTDTVAAFLFPNHAANQIDAAGYQRILETADTLCHELGYVEIIKLTPPDVPFNQMGLYWAQAEATTTSTTDAASALSTSSATDAASALSAGVPQSTPEPESVIIHAGPGRVEMMQDGLLLDARLSQLGVDEVTRQHFKIPVTASDGVIDLMRRAVASNWPNDFKGLWHDICGMSIAGGKDIGPNERLFTVIIRGVDRRRYWQMKAVLKHDQASNPYLSIRLADEPDEEKLFELGHVVMTPGVAALDVDLAPFLARHAQGDWGDDLDSFDRRQNDIVVEEGYRILSAYDVPIGNEETERIWIITESDRSCTTVLLPSEY
jgi:hypothetical protein